MEGADVRMANMRVELNCRVDEMIGEFPRWLKRETGVIKAIVRVT